MGKTKMDTASLQERVDQLEDEQKHALETGEAITRLTQRLMAVAEGQDKNFDQQLRQVEEQLKSFPPPPAFLNRANSLVSNSVKAIQVRDRAFQSNLEALQKMVRQLSSLTEAEEVQDRLAGFQADCEEQIEQYYNYPSLLSNLGGLQELVLRHLDGQIESVESSSGGAEETEDQQLLCSHIGVLLLKLLEKLTIPKNMQPVARKLLAKIEKGFGWGELETVLADSIDLAVKATASGHQDFETYLLTLNNQLGDIQSFLSESREHQQESKASAEKLDQTLRDDVAQMEITLTKSDSLDQLKSSVRVQLSDIVNAVDRYREEQSEREDKAAERLKVLHERIDDMEKKSADIQSKLEEQKLLAVLDPLTGLPNRAAYDDKMIELLGKDSAQAMPLSMVVCDIDHFKLVNDNFGHLAGDKVLRLVAKILRGGLRESDFIGRYGGEEFVVVMPQTSVEQAKEMMDKLRRVIQQSPFNFKGQPVSVTVSFGVAGLNPAESAEGLFSRADTALYRAKEEGRNRCIIAD